MFVSDRFRRSLSEVWEKYIYIRPYLSIKKRHTAYILGGGVVRWGTRQPGMKKVLLGESEDLTPVRYIVKFKFVQNMDNS